MPHFAVKQNLIEYINSQLIEATRPSQLKVNYETLQSYLLIKFGPMDCQTFRFCIFCNTIMSLVYALGLHKGNITSLSTNKKLERILVYRIVLLSDIFHIYTLGLPSKFVGDVDYNYCVPKSTFTYYFKSLGFKIVILRSCVLLIFWISVL